VIVLFKESRCCARYYCKF